MADSVRTTKMMNNENGEASMNLPVKIGLNSNIQIPITKGASLMAVLDFVAQNQKWQIGELFIVREGEPGLLDPNSLIDGQYPANKRHHVHHKGQVEVVVYYNGGDWRHHFSRNTTIEEVLLAAARHFLIDGSIIPQLQLALHGQKEELSATEHLGHLAGRENCLALDIIRGAMPNGAS